LLPGQSSPHKKFISFPFRVFFICTKYLWHHKTISGFSIRMRRFELHFLHVKPMLFTTLVRDFLPHGKLIFSLNYWQKFCNFGYYFFSGLNIMNYIPYDTFVEVIDLNFDIFRPCISFLTGRRQLYSRSFLCSRPMFFSDFLNQCFAFTTIFSCSFGRLTYRECARSFFLASSSKV
jgi:hypothetical protein